MNYAPYILRMFSEQIYLYVGTSPVLGSPSTCCQHDQALADQLEKREYASVICQDFLTVT